MTVRLGGDVDRAVSPSTTAVVVDLTGVSFFSLEAAGMLLGVVHQCRHLQLQLRVVPSSAVMRKLTMLGLHDIVFTSSRTEVGEG